MSKTLESLMVIQSKITVPKGRSGQGIKYKYRSCSDILEAVKPLLKEQSAVVLMSDEIVSVDGCLFVKATAQFCVPECPERLSVVAYARTIKEKPGNMNYAQETGSASSYARKYALCGLFAIDDSRDPDTDEYNGYAEAIKKQVAEAKVTKTEKSALSQAQTRRLYAIASSAGYYGDTVKKHIKSKYGVEPSAMTKAQYDEMCEGYQKIIRDEEDDGAK